MYSTWKDRCSVQQDEVARTSFCGSGSASYSASGSASRSDPMRDLYLYIIGRVPFKYQVLTIGEYHPH
jgi:hypothetical protein